MVKLKIYFFLVVSLLLSGCNTDSEQSNVKYTIDEVTNLHMVLRPLFKRYGFNCCYDGPLGYSGHLEPLKSGLTKWSIVPIGSQEIVGSLELTSKKIPEFRNILYLDKFISFDIDVISDIEGNSISIQKILEEEL